MERWVQNVAERKCATMKGATCVAWRQWNANLDLVHTRVFLNHHYHSDILEYSLHPRI